MTKADLKRMWDNGKIPGRSEFSGKYEVKIYPRWLWWWLVDVKIINVLGRDHNVAWGFVTWGRFHLSFGVDGEA